MSEECGVENHTENTTQFETGSSDCFSDDTKPSTNTVGKQPNDIFGITVERQNDNHESKVVTLMREVEAGTSSEADSGEKMTSFPSISDSDPIQVINIADTDANDNKNASHGPVYNITTGTLDPSSPVGDLSQTKNHAGNTESPFAMRHYGGHLRRRGDSREWEEPEFEFDDIGIDLEAAAARHSSGKLR